MRRAGRQRKGTEGGRERRTIQISLSRLYPPPPSVCPPYIHNTWGLKEDHPDQQPALFVLLIFTEMFILLSGLGLILTRRVWTVQRQTETLPAMPEKKKTKHWTELFLFLVFFLFFLTVCCFFGLLLPTYTAQ